MKWMIQAIQAELNCDEATARNILELMEEGFDGHFSELTSDKSSR